MTSFVRSIFFFQDFVSYFGAYFLTSLIEYKTQKSYNVIISSCQFFDLQFLILKNKLTHETGMRQNWFLFL